MGNTFEIFQFTAWSAITLYLIVGVRFRSSLLGYFTACLAAVLTLTSLAIPAWDATRRTQIFGGNPWVELHASLALFSYGVFALLALTALLLLLRHLSLQRKLLGGWFSFLPPIVDLDHISLRLLITGVGFMTFAVLGGTSYWARDPSSVNISKLIATNAVWLAYSVALVLRLRGHLLAKRFAWTCLILFAAALLSLGPVDASRKTPPADATPDGHANAGGVFIGPLSRNDAASAAKRVLLRTGINAYVVPPSGGMFAGFRLKAGQHTPSPFLGVRGRSARERALREVRASALPTPITVRSRGLIHISPSTESSRLSRHDSGEAEPAVVGGLDYDQVIGKPVKTWGSTLRPDRPGTSPFRGAIAHAASPR